jgi:putative transcriptional regulator
MLWYIIAFCCYFISSMDKKEVFVKRLGVRLRQLRESKGITQQQVAHLIGKDQQAIQRLESGNTNPTLFFVFQVAFALDVTLKDLFDY